MKNLLFTLLLIPALSFAQDLDYEQRYFTLGTEIDAKHAIQGNYNGIYKIGYTAEAFRVETFYDTYASIDYISYGLNVGVLLFRDRIIKMPVLAQLSLIERPTAFTPSIGINSGLETHIGNFIFSLKGELKHRSDFRKYYGNKNEVRFSGYVGIAYKL